MPRERAGEGPAGLAGAPDRHLAPVGERARGEPGGLERHVAGDGVAAVGPGEPGGRLAPVEQDLGDVREPVSGGGEAQPEVVVLGEVAVAPAPRRLEHPAPDGRGGVDERRLDEQVPGHELRRHEPVQPGGVAGHPARHVAAREEPDAGAHRGERRVGVERGELPLDAAWVGHVVGVHPHHHLCVAAGEPPVQGARRSPPRARGSPGPAGRAGRAPRGSRRCRRSSRRRRPRARGRGSPAAGWRRRPRARCPRRRGPAGGRPPGASGPAIPRSRRRWGAACRRP